MGMTRTGVTGMGIYENKNNTSLHSPDYPGYALSIECMLNTATAQQHDSTVSGCLNCNPQVLHPTQCHLGS